MKLALKLWLSLFLTDTSLSYLNARYYNSRQGQFISEDPSFLAIGSASFDQRQLMNPQFMNSYSYANGNPVNMSDPSGKAASLVSVIQSLIKALQSLLSIMSGGAGSSGSTVASTPPTAISGGSSSGILTGGSTTWDPVTDKRIGQLDPKIRKSATDFINKTEADLNVRLMVVEGYRSSERQNELYERGRTTPGPIVTNAKGGESLHNYGRAIDVAATKNGQPNFDKRITSDIANIGTSNGFSWGGSWSGGFKDYPHFEVPYPSLSSYLKP